ncbi:hypothetical protein DL96DRAFT_1291219 [Flagelloscypha sp. PMI_526]|nr:hypothetical protein DL96DRAFT_1291219 [Flagelloscypha sp. PMI_526]
MVTNLEKKVHVTLEHSGVWRTGLQISLQSFAVIYLSIVLFVTQKVYVQRMLASKQTLTKSHDESASWLGLGNAISSLYKQRSARSSQFSLSSIVLYLLASAVVKITTSALFQLPTISVPANVTVYATSRKPFPVATSPSDSNDDTNLQQIIMTLASKQWGNFTEPSLRSTIGLYDNTLYDVIPSITNTSGPVEVNSYAVEVQCHAANKSEAVLLGFPDTFGTWCIVFTP